MEARLLFGFSGFSSKSVIRPVSSVIASPKREASSQGTGIQARVTSALFALWKSSMELIDIIPEFNLYEEFWKIYTKGDIIPPQYIAPDAVVERSIISEGTEIYGEVHNSVIGAGVTIKKGAVVRDSIIMKQSTIGENDVIDKAIIAENVTIGDNVVMGIGEDVPNKEKPNVYSFGLVTVGENTVIPSDVKIGKNTAIVGQTTAQDYPDGVLESGETLNKEGETE